MKLCQNERIVLICLLLLLFKKTISFLSYVGLSRSVVLCGFEGSDIFQRARFFKMSVAILQEGWKF